MTAASHTFANGEEPDLAALVIVTDDNGFIALHEPNEDGNAGDLVASVWRDDWLPALSGRTPTPWRCYFCDETFTDTHLARDHFGYHAWEPGCVNKLVQGDQSRRMELVRTETAFRKAIEERNALLEILSRISALKNSAHFIRFDSPLWVEAEAALAKVQS